MLILGYLLPIFPLLFWFTDIFRQKCSKQYRYTSLVILGTCWFFCSMGFTCLSFAVDVLSKFPTITFTSETLCSLLLCSFSLTVNQWEYIFSEIHENKVITTLFIHQNPFMYYTSIFLNLSTIPTITYICIHKTCCYLT